MISLGIWGSPRGLGFFKSTLVDLLIRLGFPVAPLFEQVGFGVGVHAKEVIEPTIPCWIHAILNAVV